MTLLFATHERYLDHLAGRDHPERPERLGAVIDGLADAAIADAVVALEPRRATRDELLRVHPAEYLDRIEAVCHSGGGRLDADTSVSTGSWDAALLAAGAGLAAVEALDRHEAGASAAFCAVRPPGHHATPVQSMGFCVVSNIAVVAAHLAAKGERVMIVDIDAHHGNGTQDVFYADPRVLFVSFHQWPLYPGTGSAREVGDGDGIGTTMNLPLPPFSTGDRYLAAIDGVVSERAQRFAPTWLLVSAGFDAHRNDPITDLGLSAGDYHLITERLLQFAPAGRRLVMLEGGYDLDALRMSSAALSAGLLGRSYQPEPPTSGGPGGHVARDVERFWVDHGLL